MVDDTYTAFTQQNKSVIRQLLLDNGLIIKGEHRDVSGNCYFVTNTPSLLDLAKEVADLKKQVIALKEVS